MSTKRSMCAMMLPETAATKIILWNANTKIADLVWFMININSLFSNMGRMCLVTGCWPSIQIIIKSVAERNKIFYWYVTTQLQVSLYSNGKILFFSYFQKILSENTFGWSHALKFSWSDLLRLTHIYFDICCPWRKFRYAGIFKLLIRVDN